MRASNLCIALLLVAGCTFEPIEVEPINGVKTYSVTSNRVAQNRWAVGAALRELEREAVPLYMQSVCPDGRHRIVSRSPEIVEPYTGGGGGLFVKRTFLVQCA